MDNYESIHLIAHKPYKRTYTAQYRLSSSSSSSGHSAIPRGASTNSGTKIIPRSPWLIPTPSNNDDIPPVTPVSTDTVIIHRYLNAALYPCLANHIMHEIQKQQTQSSYDPAKDTVPSVHPQVLHLRDAFIDYPDICVVVDYLDGGNIIDYYRHGRNSNPYGVERTTSTGSTNTSTSATTQMNNHLRSVYSWADPDDNHGILTVNPEDLQYLSSELIKIFQALHARSLSYGTFHPRHIYLQKKRNKNNNGDNGIASLSSEETNPDRRFLSEYNIYLAPLPISLLRVSAIFSSLPEPFFQNMYVTGTCGIRNHRNDRNNNRSFNPNHTAEHSKNIRSLINTFSPALYSSPYPNFDPYFDIWCLGCCLVELCTGESLLDSIDYYSFPTTHRKNINRNNFDYEPNSLKPSNIIDIPRDTEYYYTKYLIYSWGASTPKSFEQLPVSSLQSFILQCLKVNCSDYDATEAISNPITMETLSLHPFLRNEAVIDEYPRNISPALTLPRRDKEHVEQSSYSDNHRGSQQQDPVRSGYRGREFFSEYSNNRGKSTTNNRDTTQSTTDDSQRQENTPSTTLPTTHKPSISPGALSVNNKPSIFSVIHRSSSATVNNPKPLNVDASAWTRSTSSPPLTVESNNNMYSESHSNRTSSNLTDEIDRCMDQFCAVQSQVFSIFNINPVEFDAIQNSLALAGMVHELPVRNSTPSFPGKEELINVLENLCLKMRIRGTMESVVEGTNVTQEILREAVALDRQYPNHLHSTTYGPFTLLVIDSILSRSVDMIYGEIHRGSLEDTEIPVAVAMFLTHLMKKFDTSTTAPINRLFYQRYLGFIGILYPYLFFPKDYAPVSTSVSYQACLDKDFYPYSEAAACLLGHMLLVNNPLPSLNSVWNYGLFIERIIQEYPVPPMSTTAKDTTNHRNTIAPIGDASLNLNTICTILPVISTLTFVCLPRYIQNNIDNGGEENDTLYFIQTLVNYIDDLHHYYDYNSHFFNRKGNNTTMREYRRGLRGYFHILRETCFGMETNRVHDTVTSYTLWNILRFKNNTGTVSESIVFNFTDDLDGDTVNVNKEKYNKPNISPLVLRTTSAFPWGTAVPPAEEEKEETVAESPLSDWNPNGYILQLRKKTLTSDVDGVSPIFTLDSKKITTFIDTFEKDQENYCELFFIDPQRCRPSRYPLALAGLQHEILIEPSLTVGIDYVTELYELLVSLFRDMRIRGYMQSVVDVTRKCQEILRNALLLDYYNSSAGNVKKRSPSSSASSPPLLDASTAGPCTRIVIDSILARCLSHIVDEIDRQNHRLDDSEIFVATAMVLTNLIRTFEDPSIVYSEYYYPNNEWEVSTDTNLFYQRYLGYICTVCPFLDPSFPGGPYRRGISIRTGIYLESAALLHGHMLYVKNAIGSLDGLWNFRTFIKRIMTMYPVGNSNTEGKNDSASNASAIPVSNSNNNNSNDREKDDAMLSELTLNTVTALVLVLTPFTFVSLPNYCRANSGSSGSEARVPNDSSSSDTSSSTTSSNNSLFSFIDTYTRYIQGLDNHWKTLNAQLEPSHPHLAYRYTIDLRRYFSYLSLYRYLGMDRSVASVSSSSSSSSSSSNVNRKERLTSSNREVDPSIQNNNNNDNQQGDTEQQVARIMKFINPHTGKPGPVTNLISIDEDDDADN